MSHSDDWVGQGNNSGYLFVSFWNENSEWLGVEEISELMNSDMPADEWVNMEFRVVIPEGTAYMNVGTEFYQESANDHGSVYFDNVDWYKPLTTTGFFVSNGMFADLALEAGVNDVTVAWDVWSFDGFEATPSSSGSRELNIHVDEAYASLHGVDLPTEFALHNNYPNPFNPVTNILYDIPEVSDVSLEIYNVMGQRVRTLVQGTQEPGRYQIIWNATNDFGQALSSGMYIYRIQAGDFVSVKKLVLMK